MTEDDPLKVFIREWYMWAIQLVPSWRRELKKGARALGMTKYRYSPGLGFIGEMGGGLNLPQVYAYNFRTQKVCFTDDLIFSTGKTGLFQLVILPNNIKEIEPLTRDLPDINHLSENLILSEEATVLIQSTKASLSPAEISIPQQIARIAPGDEFAADPELCKNRPPPIGYDELRIQKEVRGKKYVILRPDRFVFAACDTPAQLKEAIRKLPSALHLNSKL